MKLLRAMACVVSVCAVAAASGCATAGGGATLADEAGLGGDDDSGSGPGGDGSSGPHADGAATANDATAEAAPSCPNDPAMGCSATCGAPCTAPNNAVATCSDAGACDFSCTGTFLKADGGCGCPMGQMACASGCAQCCNDLDCPNHTACTTGMCMGCVANYADCDNNPQNGCETALNQDGNCGACGTSCCGSFCGCGFLGLGGKSCKAQGTGYSCQC